MPMTSLSQRIPRLLKPVRLFFFGDIRRQTVRNPKPLWSFPPMSHVSAAVIREAIRGRSLEL
jgi:hypothetical protein